MRKNAIRNRPWYANAVAICIGVILYVLLTHWSAVGNGLSNFFGFFSPVLLGCVLAYLVNPLAKLYRRRLFHKVKSEKKQITLANLLAIITLLAFIILLLIVILPQLLDSIVTFADNLDGYVAALESVMEKWGMSGSLDSLVNSSETLLDTAVDYIKDHLSSIISTSANVGKRLFQWVIGFILSIYLLAEKDGLKAGIKRLLTALLGDARYDKTAVFLHRCDSILNRYIVYNLLDSLIVGFANAVFMLVTRMPYMGLVSVVVAITNLIPTFGPVIGGVIGAFVLILVKPWYAVAFLAFTLVLQICDGYIIKPRLFGNSLGVSGLWILIGVIVGGRMFGVMGILVAIPAVAVLDVLYQEYILPWLEKRRNGVNNLSS